MALTMYDRARLTGKAAEANIFRAWLVNHLVEAVSGSEDVADDGAATQAQTTHG